MYNHILYYIISVSGIGALFPNIINGYDKWYNRLSESTKTTLSIINIVFSLLVIYIWYKCKMLFSGGTIIENIITIILAIFFTPFYLIYLLATKKC